MLWSIGIFMSNNIAGKVVVITGASSGLGEATARLLSAPDATVALGARRVDRLKSRISPFKERLDGKVADWMEQVSDEQYRVGR